MISLSDAIRLESNNPAVNSFKPWWEVAVDYTMNAFLLVVLFALAGVTISGTPGLVCLPVDTDHISFVYATNNYANAKCTTHVDGHVLIVFPYIIFIQWLLLFVLHLSWFNLPSLKAFLSSTFDSFTIFKQVEESAPRVKRKVQKDEKSLRHQDTKQDEAAGGANPARVESSEEDSDDMTLSSVSGRNTRLAHVVAWLQYLLQFRYNLVNMYAAKALLICALTAIFTIAITSWLVYYKWKTAFLCDLHGALPPPYDFSECSFAAAPYVYSMMIMNVIFTILLFIFNMRALFWLARFRYGFKRYISRWAASENKHPLKDKPGFYDYYFCVKLFKANSSEGLVVCSTMESAFEAFSDKLPEEASTTSEVALAVPKEPSYSYHQFVTNEILRELGMTRKRSTGSHDNLWAALANSLDEGTLPLTGSELLKVEGEICEKVVEGLLVKHMVFKDLINKDDRCPVFEDYLDEIKQNKRRQNGIIEDHYIFMVFAFLYRLNIVVIRAKQSSLLYEPEHPEENQSVRFITFVPPCYYYAAVANPEAPGEKSNAGLNFVTDQVVQTELVKKVNELWHNEGYVEYKKTLENILPQSLSYKITEEKGQKKPSEEREPIRSEGIRLRFRKQKINKSESENVEPFLLETV